jgi:D-alanine--poly(phosphoribitol) ligase subunit 1
MDVVSRFLEIASKLGNHPAVIASGGITSYRELALEARRFATRFAQTPGARVIIAFEQGPIAYAAMMGAMLAGGYYVPVSVAAPEEKLQAICKAFSPDFIAGESGIAQMLKLTCPSASVCARADVAPMEPIHAPVPLNEVAYVIFTSGSTGQPKGVTVAHAALGHYIDWVCNSGLFESADRVSQYSNIAFDLSVIEIFGALACGATLVPFTSRSQRLLPAETVATSEVSVWISVPSVISLMSKANQLNATNLRSVRRFFFCGEPLLEEHVAGILAACPGAEIWNSYGPTEATVSMTCVKITKNKNRDAVQSSVALGDPIPGM